MKKLLIIEDDQATDQAYSNKFSKTYQVVVATNGKDGFTKAIQEKPDLVLLDIMLPGGLNGFDVLRNLKHNSETVNIPVIVLTNLSEQEDAAKEAGALECLVKANTDINKVGSVISKYLK